MREFDFLSGNGSDQLVHRGCPTDRSDLVALADAIEEAVTTAQNDFRFRWPLTDALNPLGVIQSVKEKTVLVTPLNRKTLQSCPLHSDGGPFDERYVASATASMVFDSVTKTLDVDYRNGVVRMDGTVFDTDHRPSMAYTVNNQTRHAYPQVKVGQVICWNPAENRLLLRYPFSVWMRYASSLRDRATIIAADESKKLAADQIDKRLARARENVRSVNLQGVKPTDKEMVFELDTTFCPVKYVGIGYSHLGQSGGTAQGTTDFKADVVQWSSRDITLLSIDGMPIGSIRSGQSGVMSYGRGLDHTQSNELLGFVQAEDGAILKAHNFARKETYTMPFGGKTTSDFAFGVTLEELFGKIDAASSFYDEIYKSAMERSGKGSATWT